MGHDHEHETAEDTPVTITKVKQQNTVTRSFSRKPKHAKTTFEVREIQPASFNQVVKTTGQVLAAPR